MDTLTKKEKIQNKIIELEEIRKKELQYDISKETKKFLVNQTDELIRKYIFRLNDIEIEEEKSE